MKLDDMVSALQSGTLTCELAENIITLIEFVKNLPFDLEQCKEKEYSLAYDSNLFNGAINQGVDRSIGHIEDFVNALETSGID